MNSTHQPAGGDAKVFAMLADMPHATASLIASMELGMTDAAVAMLTPEALQSALTDAYRSGTLDGAAIHDAYCSAPDEEFELH